MARGINKVILVGNVGQDPEVRYTPGGSAVANLSLATSETWNDKQTGQRQERTEWHRVVFFARLAEIVGEYVKKGSQIYVEGRLQTRKWQDQNGNDRYTTEIIANEMQLLGGRGDGAQNQGYGAPAGGQQQGFAAPQNAGGYGQPQANAPRPNSAPQGGFDGYQQQSPQQPQAAPQPAYQQPPQQQPQQPQNNAPAPSGFDDFDDDIPF